jgi:hypothetical protein
MKDYSNYMGGTNISFEGLNKYYDTFSMDGTNMKLADYFNELEVFDSLIPDVSKVFVPYGGVTDKHGILKRVVWDKYCLCDYGHANEENDDWWFFEPYLIVELDGSEYNIYEYSYWDENKEVIHINRITPQTVEVFTPADRSMGFVNEYEFNDLRVQIATNELEGYYVLHDNEKLFISSDGHLSNWGTGMFDLMEIQISKMFQAGRGKKLKLK